MSEEKDQGEAPKESSEPIQKKRVAIYLRMSHEDDDNEESLGLGRQETDIRALVAEHDNWEITECLQDEASGYGSKEAERKGFQRLEHLVRAGQVEIVVAYAIDRISRRIVATGKFAELLDDHDVQLVTVREREVDFLQLHLHAMLAHAESNSMAKRLQAKFKHDFLKGDADGPIPKGGVVPYGFRRCEDKTDRQYYDVVEHEAEMIRVMAAAIPGIKAKPKESTSTELIHQLKDLDAKTNRGRRAKKDRAEDEPSNPWTWQAIKHKLLSPTIAGYMRHHDLIRKAQWKPIIPFAEWQELVGYFGVTIKQSPGHDEGILRMEGHQVTEAIKSQRQRGRLERVGCLTGLLFTATGEPMSADKSTSIHETDRDRNITYEVYASKAPGVHTSIQREYLELQVFKRIETRLIVNDSGILGIYPKLVQRSTHDVQTDLDQASKELAKLIIHEGELPALDVQIDIKKTEVRRLQNELNGIAENYLQLSPSNPREFTLERWLETATPDKKFVLVSALIERIEIGSNQFAINEIKERYNITTDHQWRTLQRRVEHPWLEPELDLKTQLKADWRTTIYWRDGEVSEPGSYFDPGFDDLDLSDEDQELYNTQPQRAA